MAEGNDDDDDSKSAMSDNVSATGSDSSFFDPPIEYYRTTPGTVYGLDSRETSGGGIVMRKTTNRINPSESQTLQSDFDNEFANREKQLTPEHTPFKIKDIHCTSIHSSKDLSVMRNSTIVNNSHEEDNNYYLRDRSLSQGPVGGGYQTYNNKKKDTGFMSSGLDDIE